MSDTVHLPVAYVETTIPSYLAADFSRDLVIAGHQQITHEWWQSAQSRYALVTSEFTFVEISEGNPLLAIRRRSILENTVVLATNTEVRRLASVYEVRLGLTGKARSDVTHLAFAVAYELDYLVTWNCAHIANGEIIRKLLEVNRELGKSTPLIVTPESLLE